MALQSARHFIIGGTEKAGTTSVFTYLSEHPAVCASSRKETDFFRSEASEGEACAALAQYRAYFDRFQPPQAVAMEASPGYLGLSAEVAPRIARLLPEARLLFILREPAERFASSFRFHQERFNVPADLSLDGYFAACRAYEAGDQPAVALDDWYLKVLNFGCYADRLAPFLAAFPREQILIKLFDELGQDPQGFMGDVSAFLGIDAGLWQDYEFHRQNVTFASRFGALHKMALRANDLLEPVLRRNPGIKRQLLAIYKSMNGAPLATDTAEQQTLAELGSYYSDSNRRLAELMGTELPAGWSRS